MIGRREFLTALGGAGALSSWAQAAPAPEEAFRAQGNPLGLTLSPDQLAAGTAFLKRHPSVDVHAHPGRFFLRDMTVQTPQTKAFGAPFEDKVVADMGAGRVSAALFAGVADGLLLGPTVTGGLAATREFEPGEAWSDYQRQIIVLKAMVARHLVASGRSTREIEAAHRANQTACVFAIEGGDFIEDRLDRVVQARADGVRAITIVHYHTNQIGDPQTSSPRYNGLTPIGREIVKAMNREGLIVDLAHASYETTRDAVAVSTQPMMISHSNLQTPAFTHPRLLTLEHAKLVTSHGGLIGSVPSGLGQKTFADWVDSILRLIEAVGADHVAIGTDMDANFMPVFADYRGWGLIPGALLARGLGEAETAKVIGGNFLRLFTRDNHVHA